MKTSSFIKTLLFLIKESRTGYGKKKKKEKRKRQKNKRLLSNCRTIKTKKMKFRKIIPLPNLKQL